MLLGLAIGVVALPTAAQTTLRYSDHQPLEGMRTTFIKEVLFKEIEKESEGRLKIDAHWDAELSTGYDGLKTVGRGEKADIAVVVPEYMADALPLHQLFKSFPVGPSGDDQVTLFRKIYADIPEFSEELAANNAVEIFLSTGYPVGFFGTKPLNDLSEISGQKWRSASFWHLDFLKSAGAQPVKMHWGKEIYNALDAGELDGIMVNIDSAYNLDLHKTATHALVSKNLWLGHLYLIAMNQDTWNNLEAQDQQAIARAAETAYSKLGDIMETSYAAMLDKLKSDGATIQAIGHQGVIEWQETTDYSRIQKDWLAGQKEKGLEDGESVLDRLTVIMNVANHH
ncbi:TRAP transporter substrate-binding protein DctP [Neptunomonas phycophila]|uniref:TRAP transporter substrate-binding protein DctP n=1 Tax=Neptunomonas phycophila TaxID=1572645 RepID=UPI001BEBE6CC|nr:TRAP transporter substrate-binding protein DctP [Neptunomonas phycophila]MBT3145931.1 TRAP transporter substrate-binding protein DctP [Neptunomonas phycophila]